MISTARSSAVEHFGDIEGVIGSNPIAPTTIKLILIYFMYIRTRTITALNESQLNMWLANFKINGCPAILKLGALRVTVGRLDKNKAIVMTMFEDKKKADEINNSFKDIQKQNREFLKVEVHEGEVVVDMEAKNINNLK